MAHFLVTAGRRPERISGSGINKKEGEGSQMRGKESRLRESEDSTYSATSKNPHVRVSRRRKREKKLLLRKRERQVYTVATSLHRH